jgi:hypothetical protein
VERFAIQRYSLTLQALTDGRVEWLRNTERVGSGEARVRRLRRDETRTCNQASGEGGDCVLESSRSKGISGFRVGEVTLAIARRVRVGATGILISSKRRSRWKWPSALTVAVFGLPWLHVSAGTMGLDWCNAMCGLADGAVAQSRVHCSEDGGRGYGASAGAGASGGGGGSASGSGAAGGAWEPRGRGRTRVNGAIELT